MKTKVSLYVLILLALLGVSANTVFAQSDLCTDGQAVVVDTVNKRYKCLTAEVPITFNSPLSRSTNTISCSTCATTANKLNVFASTTSAELASVLSDETGGGGGFVRRTTPQIDNPTITSPIIGTGGTSISKHLSTTATLDFANLAAIGCEDLTVTLTGAAVGDTVAIGVPNGSVVTNGTFFGWVSATNTVSIKFCTVVSGDPASGSFRVDVWQH